MTSLRVAEHVRRQGSRWQRSKETFDVLQHGTEVALQTQKPRRPDLLGIVCTQNGVYSTRAAVIASIDAGQDWQTYGGGQYARIKKTAYCRPGCVSPYITTYPDHTTANNLDNLPPC